MAVKGARWSASEIEYIKKNYPYVPGPMVAERLGRPLKSMCNLAAKLGIKKIEHNKKYVNHFYFDNWSSNMAWVLGFWAADGCAFTERTKRSIIFAQADKLVLEMVKKEFCSDHKISRLENSLGVSYQLKFASRRIYKRLKEIFGCEIERKSTTLLWPDLLPDAYFRDFARGLIDGDGSVTFCSGCPTISFSCGSDAFIQRFAREIERATGFHRNVSKNVGTDSLSYNAFMIRPLARFLYYDGAELAIERKRVKAEMIKTFSEKHTNG